MRPFEVIHAGVEELAVVLGRLIGIGLHSRECKAPGVGYTHGNMPRIDQTETPMKDGHGGDSGRDCRDNVPGSGGNNVVKVEVVEVDVVEVVVVVVEVVDVLVVVAAVVVVVVVVVVVEVVEVVVSRW